MGTGRRSRLEARRKVMVPYVSLREMAHRVGVTATAVQRWETGRRTPFPRQWDDIARGYMWPVEKLAWPVGRDLQMINGQLTEHAGWSAYDAGQHDAARQFLHEALAIAQMANSDRLATCVMASMALQDSTSGRPADAVALTDAAKRSARGFGTRRLESLLCAREAMAHARRRDVRSCDRALARAELMLNDHGPDDEDWLAFWGPADLFWHGALAQLALGSNAQAEQFARQAVDEVDPAYRRNNGLYLAVLGTALVEGGELEEAASVAATALPHAGHVASGRLLADLRALRNQLIEHRTATGVETYLAQYDAAGLAC